MRFRLSVRSRGCNQGGGDYSGRVRVSVIVPAFNEEQLLAVSLEKIQQASRAFSRRGWEVELIVCDNNSTDRTAEIARAAGAVVVFEPINQIARARNAGAAVANGDWLVFVDADSHPCAGLFADVAEHMVSGRTLAGGSTLRMDEKSFNGSIASGVWNRISRWTKLMAGSFIFVEAEVFHRVGGFSHEWFVGEELELSRRLMKLARKTERRLVILHRNPLQTSARKIRLYTPWEHLGFLARTLLSGGGSMRDRKSNHLWYDGRR
jgi:glycosyltransferase involved in cell wall biosynthesis